MTCGTSRNGTASPAARSGCVSSASSANVPCGPRKPTRVIGGKRSGGVRAPPYGHCVRHWTLAEATAALPDVRAKVERIREPAHRARPTANGQGAAPRRRDRPVGRRAPGRRHRRARSGARPDRLPARSRRRARPTCSAGSTARTPSTGGTGPTPGSPGARRSANRRSSGRVSRCAARPRAARPRAPRPRCPASLSSCAGTISVPIVRRAAGTSRPSC